MVRIWRGGVSWAEAGVQARRRQSSRNETAAHAASKPGFGCKRRRGPGRRALITRSIIDHDPPRHAADRDRDYRLAARRVDHRDVVAESIGDIERLFVVRERD